MKKLFIMIMVLMFTTMLFSLSQPTVTAAINFEIETATGDQDGTFITLPEVATGIAEFYEIKAIITKSQEETEMGTHISPMINSAADWEWKNEITEIAGGSVLKMPSLTLVVNIDCDGYLSAGALKIPNYNIRNPVINIENCDRKLV